MQFDEAVSFAVEALAGTSGGCEPSDCLRAHEQFVMAALEYCRLWTRDQRNALDTAAVALTLEQARGRMYEEYRKLEGSV